MSYKDLVRTWRCEVGVLKPVLLLGLLSATALFAGQADATSITVTNFSFESPSLGGTPGAYTIGSCPTGWNCSGGGGVYVPTSTQFSPGSDGLPGSEIVPNGSQAAWTNNGATPQELEQDVGTIAANTIYTLNVWAGARADQQDAWALGFQPTIELTANGVVVDSLVTTDPGSGQWLDSSLTWAAIAGDVGDTLSIVLLVSPGDTDATQVAWDDVTLNAVDNSVVTPLPAALPLFAAGLGMLGLFVSRRKRKNLVGTATA